MHTRTIVAIQLQSYDHVIISCDTEYEDKKRIIRKTFP